LVCYLRYVLLLLPHNEININEDYFDDNCDDEDDVVCLFLYLREYFKIHTAVMYPLGWCGPLETSPTRLVVASIQQVERRRTG